MFLSAGEIGPWREVLLHPHRQAVSFKNGKEQQRAAVASATRIPGETVPDQSSAAKKPIRVLLLEDSDADAELISSELRRSSTPAVIERVDSRAAFLYALETFSPDVVLSDHSLGHFDSHAALELLRAARPATPFIIVTGALPGSLTGAAIRAGAEDVFLKADLGDLGASISGALNVRRPLQSLSKRQLEVLRMIAEGHRTRDIAHRLGLGVKTVESHRYALMKRLKASSVVSLVCYAVRVGLIAIDPGVREHG